MSLISEYDGFSVEEKKIIEWAQENSNLEYLGYNWKEDVTSYFREFADEDNVMEFKFDNIAELKEQLESMWGQDEAMKKMTAICSVAAFRNRPQNTIGEHEETKRTGEDQETFSIPDFVYVF